MKTIKASLFFLSVIASSLLWAQSSPVPMLENAANQVINSLKQNRGHLKQNHQVIYRAVEQHLLPIVDVTGMSRSVLGRNVWNKATAAEKRAFTREFTQLVIRTYASPLAEYSDEKVKFLPLRGGINSRFVRVNSVIVRSNGQNIPLSYSLVSKNGQWKIYDLSVEGVSLLQSFRSQFSQVLQNSNMQELIQQMRKQKAA
ncbi:MlaC/ttg2D family ABC transporter substrate-binding protein [Legionella londiniensis]|uniref:Toluene tolerance protein Ttg2D n=1 Tax=Legionella londiniensis TaxID=45068 RepID=A0A0W0VKT5_9GAMM|nr:ABC transporter substrate-binding protein [Legionella londiniensis]KTD20716.1 toluene tolerance protein Ttg2D [Legionella londiniensis]STX92811.1 signal peptide protein, toluene tolerance protein Ttg2D [Legionella londiniensis]